MSSDATEQGPTDQEIQLGNQAVTKYNAAQQLSGGTEYLLNTLNDDSVGRDTEKSNAQNAVAFSQMADSNEETLPADLRQYGGGEVAAMAQNDSDNASTIMDLSGSNLGLMASNSSAAYASAQREMAENAANTAAKQQSNMWVPSLAGNVIGTYAGGGFDHWMSKDSAYNSKNIGSTTKNYLSGLLPTSSTE